MGLFLYSLNSKRESSNLKNKTAIGAKSETPTAEPYSNGCEFGFVWQLSAEHCGE